MKFFRDTETGAVFAFDDDVEALRRDAGGWAFIGPDGVELPSVYPMTLEPTTDSTPPVVPLTSEQVQSERDGLLQLAALRIAPLQDAVDIGDATAAEEAQLLAWKKYRVVLNRLDLTVNPVSWPAPPA
jgi:hypothetical protein